MHCAIMSGAASSSEISHRSARESALRIPTGCFAAVSCAKRLSFDTKLQFVNHHEAHGLAAHRLERRADPYDGWHWRQCELQHPFAARWQIECHFGREEWLAVRRGAAQRSGGGLWLRDASGRISQVAP
jgi:hypothetical protein